MAQNSMTEAVDPLHVSELDADQAARLGAATAAAGRALVDLDGYVADDAVTVSLRTHDATEGD